MYLQELGVPKYLFFFFHHNHPPTWAWWKFLAIFYRERNKHRRLFGGELLSVTERQEKLAVMKALSLDVCKHRELSPHKLMGAENSSHSWD